MSRTPDFGGDQDINDGINVSLSPSLPPQGKADFSLDAITRAITSAVHPIWAKLNELSAKSKEDNLEHRLARVQVIVPNSLTIPRRPRSPMPP
jgi:hypothetical protein